MIAKEVLVDLVLDLGRLAQLLEKTVSSMCGTRCQRFSNREIDLATKMRLEGLGMNNATSQGMWVDVLLEHSCPEGAFAHGC